MRALCIAPVLTLVLWMSSASADTFGGFSSLEPSYLVNQDRVCGLLAADGGAAAGPARCERAPADRLAKLSFQAAPAQRGAKALFTATASGRTLVISRQGGGEVVRWEALDVIAKVTEVFASHDDRVAVTFLVRRGGRELIDVIAFSLRRAETPTSPNPKVDPKLDPKADPKLDPKAAPSAPTPPKDPALDKALTSARKARGKAALLAWQRVLERSAEHAEALFGKAAAQAPRDHAGALATLGKLAASAQPDAIEYLVAARFDGAFAGLRADPTFRKLVGLDRRPQHPYDRAMGFGGVWEQAGTSCDSPTVALTLTRDKKFRLQVRTVCEGMVQQSKFAGTWQVDGGGVALTLPNRDAAADVVRCSFEPAGDEEAMACPLDEDLRIVVLPARR